MPDSPISWLSPIVVDVCGDAADEVERSFDTTADVGDGASGGGGAGRLDDHWVRRSDAPAVTGVAPANATIATIGAAIHAARARWARLRARTARRRRKGDVL